MGGHIMRDVITASMGGFTVRWRRRIRRWHEGEEHPPGEGNDANGYCFIFLLSYLFPLLVRTYFTHKRKTFEYVGTESW